jgi:hypothetical protein
MTETLLYGVVLGLFPGAAIGWWAKTQVLVSHVRVERHGNHYAVYLYNRRIASTNRLSVALARRKRFISTLKGQVPRGGQATPEDQREPSVETNDERAPQNTTFGVLVAGDYPQTSSPRSPAGA